MTAQETDDPDDGKSTDDEQIDDLGAATATFGSATATGDVEARPAESDSVDLEVRGEFLDDEPSWVHLSALFDSADVRLSLRPGEARHLAAKIESAAAYAEGEDR